jgi:hypothetical protein
MTDSLGLATSFIRVNRSEIEPVQPAYPYCLSGKPGSISRPQHEVVRLCRHSVSSTPFSRSENDTTLTGLDCHISFAQVLTRAPHVSVQVTDIMTGLED